MPSSSHSVFEVFDGGVFVLLKTLLVLGLFVIGGAVVFSNGFEKQTSSTVTAMAALHSMSMNVSLFWS